MTTSNGDVRHRQANGKAGGALEDALRNAANGTTIAGKNDAAITIKRDAQSSANFINLAICVGGIYASLFVGRSACNGHLY